MDGWMGGWMDGWMGGKAWLRIAYSNQKRYRLEVKKTSVGISNGENKMAAIIWQPFCFLTI
jgi:hypothetical protein